MNNSMQVTERLLLDAQDAAASLSISPRSLWTLTKTGEIPCIRIGRSVRYDPVDLRAWIEARKVAGNVQENHA